MLDHRLPARHAPHISLSRIREASTKLIASLALFAFSFGNIKAAVPRVAEISMPGTSGSASNGLLMSPLALVAGSNGDFYGISGGGGAYGEGGLFSVTPQGVFSDLHDMGVYEGTYNGFSPQYALNSSPQELGMLSDGTLYFSTPAGGPLSAAGANGPSPQGTISTFSTSGIVASLHTFYGSATDGINPRSVVVGPDGNFYGFTSGYSPITTSNNNGTTTWSTNSVIFQITPGGAESFIYIGTDSTPPSTFLVGGDGNIYGSLPIGTTPTQYVGSPSLPLSGDTLFQVTLTGTRTFLYTLSTTDGEDISSLMQDSHGNFFGTTTAGGQYGYGTVFEYSAQHVFTVLHSFNPQAGEGFNAGKLMIGADGNIYGVTVGGGNGNSGTLYRLAPDGVYTTLIYFSGTDGLGGGDGPNSMVQGAGRYFMGTTIGGGHNKSGLIYRLVVPIADDLFAKGASAVMAYGPGQLTSLPSITNANAITQAITQGYYPVAVGDFNGDGVADILWTSANHDLYIWFGNVSGYIPKYFGTINSGWQVVGAADMNNDGTDDIVFNNHSQHLISYQLMGNVSVSPSYMTTSYTQGYYPIAIGNFGGNGYGAIVWTSAKNDMYIWYSNAQRAYTSKYINTFPAGWSVIGRGDLDGDGVDDLVWLNSTGTEWGYWLMNANGTIGEIHAEAVPASLQGYHVATVADYNGDGRADILWTNGQSVVLMTNQGAACAAPTGCGFTLSTPSFIFPAGQIIFNSGIPMPAPMWGN